MYRKTCLALLAICLMLVLSTSVIAAPVTLTFDDIGNPDGAFIPDGYGGLDWTNMRALDGSTRVATSGYHNGRVSGDWVAYNSGGSAASASNGPFTFVSAYLTAAWNTGLNIRLDGFTGAALTHTQTVVVDTDAPTLFTFNWSGIDAVQFTSFGGVDAANDGGAGTHFALDNLTIDAVSTAVPEPTSMALFGLTALGMGVATRRRRRKDEPIEEAQVA